MEKEVASIKNQDVQFSKKNHGISRVSELAVVQMII